MKKIALLLLFTMTLTVFSPVYSARPADAIVGLPPESGKWVARQVWGVIKGCWKAYWAPKGQKLEKFEEGYKEGSEGEESKAAGLLGGIIAY